MAAPLRKDSGYIAPKSQEDKGAFSLDLAWGAPPGQDASREEKAYYALARYAVQNDHYAGLYRQWIKPLFFLVGKHWVMWNQSQARYDLDTDVPAWRQQPVTNFTYAIFRTLVAKMTKQKATLEVVPPSGDSDDRESANIAQSLLEFLWRHLKTSQKRIRAIGWLLATGNVAFRVDWDPEAGEMRPQSVQVEIADPDMPGQTTDTDCACDEDGEPYRRKPEHEADVAPDGGDPYDIDKTPEKVPIGEISLEVVEPLSYRWNPEATSSDDADEFFIATMVPRVWAQHEYDIDDNDLGTVRGDDDQQQALHDILSGITSGSPDPFNAVGDVTGSRRIDTDDRVLELRYYKKPCASEGYPEGRHWISIGGTLVWPKEGDDEYEHDEAPIPHGFWPPVVPCIDTPIPGQPQGMGVMGQVVPLNEKYNYIDGKIGEYHTTMAMGGVIWVAPEDKGITITSEPGQVKVSKAYGASGRHPIREQLSALPSAIYEERALIAQNINAIAGVSQLDMGQRPEGVSAGRAFLVIQEASDAAIMPTLTALEEAMEEVGRRELVLAQRFYTEERTLQIRGEKGKYEFLSFSNADLRDGLDVRAQSGSSAPWSKAAQWDTKLSLLQAMPQLVIKPDGTLDREQLARYLDSGVAGLGAFESDEDPDLVEIDREHAMFEAYDPQAPNASNQLPQLAVWQNQVTHQKYHFDFMKRDFGRFQRWSQPAQMAFMEHMRLTTEAIDQLAEMMAGPPGAPPPDPNAPPGAPAGPQAGEESGTEPGGGGSPPSPPGGSQPGDMGPPPSAPPAREGASMRLNKSDQRSAS